MTSASNAPAIRTDAVDYRLDGEDYQAVLIYDANSQDQPGLLLAPNWLGVTPDAARRAGLFAQRGYVVLVVDMYGTHKRPCDIAEASRLANALRAKPQVTRARMTAALDVLNREGMRRGVLDASRRAALGFCFGGGNALELARSGAPIQAAVCIHGDLITVEPAAMGDIKAAVLAVHGAADTVVPKIHRDAFEEEMSRVGAAWRLCLFGKLLHAFTDVGADIPGVAQYDQYATALSYELADQFMSRAFTGEL